MVAHSSYEFGDLLNLRRLCKTNQQTPFFSATWDAAAFPRAVDWLVGILPPCPTSLRRMVEPDDPLVLNVVGRHKAGHSVHIICKASTVELSINSGDMFVRSTVYTEAHTQIHIYAQILHNVYLASFLCPSRQHWLDSPHIMKDCHDSLGRIVMSMWTAQGGSRSFQKR